MTTTTAQHGQQSEDAWAQRLAGFTGPPERFLTEFLAAQCRAVGAAGAVMFNTLGEGGPTILAQHPPDPRQHPDAGAWIQAARQAVSQTLARAQAVAMRDAGGVSIRAYLVLVPVRDDAGKPPRGALAILLPTNNDTVAHSAIARLELAMPLLRLYELRLSLAQRDRDMQGLARAMRGLDAVNREERFRPAVIALCNEIASTWQAARVSIGILGGRYIKLRAMSHTEDLSRKTQLVQDLESAMEECLDQDAEVLVPQPESATTINRVARAYVDKHGPANLCVLPLRYQDKVVGALAAELPPDKPVTPDLIESLRLACNLFTARLYQFSKDDRWFGARLASSLREGAAVLVGPKHTWAKLVAIAGVGFIAFALLAKGGYRVEAPFTIETTRRQVVTAPFEGTIAQVGDGIEVNAPVVGEDQATGQRPATVLARLDTSELIVERSALAAQVADYQAQADAARSEGDYPAMQVALANIDRLNAQAALYDYRIDRATLTSPITGVIIEGDLRQRVNGGVDKGEALFEIAPIDALRAELLVPASRVGEVRSRADYPDDPSRGRLASAAHPGDFVGFTVDLIEPEAEVVDGGNVFRVRVTLDEPADWLRPGVEGVAQIDVDRRSYAYLWTREAVNWVRMKLWL